jgi:hypothetical protein
MSTKADCHKVGCAAAGRVCKCAAKKDCPLKDKKVKS